MSNQEVNVFKVFADRLKAQFTLENALRDFTVAVKQTSGDINADALQQATSDLADIMRRLAVAVDETRAFDDAHGWGKKRSRKASA